MKTLERNVLKILKRLFKEEDKVLTKVDNKVGFLLVSRNISLADERKKLVKARGDTRKEIKNLFIQR